MPLLSKPKDAEGKPLEAGQLYEPISPHGRGFTVYNPGVELRGSHDAVKTAPQLWIRADASSDEKAAALRRYRAAREAAQPQPPPDPTRPRILGPVPPERRRVALKNYVDKAGRWYEAGKVYDADDPFVKSNEGDLFGLVPDEAA